MDVDVDLQEREECKKLELGSCLHSTTYFALKQGCSCSLPFVRVVVAM